jgi:DNA-binding SARP family transcriptional activator
VVAAFADRAVQASLFGTLSVQVGTRRLGPSDLGGVKPKALLEMLLLARGHPVSKDTLAEALWPDKKPKNVTGTLETYVSVLRRNLFADRSQARRVLVTASGAYRLDPDEISLDIDRFDDLLHQAEQAGPRARRPLWMEAVALASGDLLEDEPYAPWVQAERELFRGRVARTHLLIAESSLFEGELDTALRHGEAALAANPFAEEAFRVVMLAHHSLGHNETARQVFQRCREVLDRELGLDPTTELVDLAGAIDAGTPAHELVEPFGREPTPPPVEHRERRDAGGLLPFLGREHELARLRAHVEGARRGQFRLVLVEGRSGFGRTTLLDRLQASLEGTVGRATYSARDAEFPSLPFAAAIRDALRTTRGSGDAECYANAPLLSGAGEARERLLALMRRYEPLVLLLDDLHWADQDTLDALAWLARRSPRLPLAVIATVRSSHHDDGAGFDRLDPFDRLRLPALTASDDLRVHGVGDEIVRIAGGNPRLMADIWRWRTAGRADLPPSIDEAVKRRVRGIGGCVPALLQAAATLPEPFDEDDLDRVFDIRDRTIEIELERLLDLAFLEEGPDGLRFVEPVVREVLATTAPAPRLTRRAGFPDDQDRQDSA